MSKVATVVCTLFSGLLLGACASNEPQRPREETAMTQQSSGGAPNNTMASGASMQGNHAMASDDSVRVSNSGSGNGRAMAENGLRADNSAMGPGGAGNGAGGAMGAHNATTNNPSAGAAGPDAERGRDSELVGLLATVDRGEIEQGTEARARATELRVRSYGQMMVDMHARSTEQLNTLAQRNGLLPRESERSRQMAQQAQSVQQRLTGLRGAAFDRAYIDAQVEGHQQALEMIDRVIVPEARNAELRDAVTREVRPMVESHLSQARTLQTALSRGGRATRTTRTPR